MNAITTTENHALASVPQAAGPLAAAMQALQAGMTIEQMQGLMGLQKDWEANEARKSYVADMAVFKLNPPQILKDKEVAYAGTQFMHATLGGVTAAVVAALAQNGFSHSWSTMQRDDGQVFVTCILTHRLGHSESTTLNSSPDQSGKKNNIQALASTVSYLQRYTLLAACGLATMDMGSDDGQQSEGSQHQADSMLDMLIDMVNEVPSLEALEITRASAISAFKKAKDANKDVNYVPLWNELKQVIEVKRATFATQGVAA